MNTAGFVFMGLGAAFVVIGSVGIVRFRDVYPRLQASGVSDNAGLGLILLGAVFHGGWQSHDAALLLLLALILLTNPIVTHSIARSAFVQQHREGDED